MMLRPPLPMIDWNKPIQTRDGRPAKFLAKLERETCPYVFAVGEGNDQFIASCGDDGRVIAGDVSGIDPVNVPEEFLSEPVYVNVYECNLPCLHPSIDLAARSIARDSRYLRTERWVFSTTRGWLKENEQTL